MHLKDHIRETLKLALPISLGQLGHIMMGVVDSIMVGKVGYAPLAAAALVNGLFFLLLVIGIGISLAATPLIAIAQSEKNNEECGRILNHSFIVNIIVSFAMIAAIYSLSFIIPLLNQPPEVTKEAIPYLKILTASIIPFILFQTYRQYLEGLSMPNAPMAIALAANILNAFLNWIFIYGNFGVPAMGLFGAGIATTSTRWLMAISLMIFMFKSKKVAEYYPAFKLKPVDKKLIKKIIDIGMPSGFQYFLEIACFTFATVMVGWIGSKQQAAHQIVLNLASTTYMIMLGISSAGMIRVGNAFGKKDINQIRLSGFTSIGLGCTLMFGFAILMLIFRNQLPHLYNDNPAVVSFASVLLIIAGLFQVFDGLQATTIGVLRGLTDVKVPFFISLFSYWIIAVPVALLLGFVFNFGLYGIWVGLLIGLGTVGISMLIRFNLKSKSLFF